MRFSAFCSLSLALLAGAPAAAQPAQGGAGALTLDELMRRMARTEGVEASFRERKEVSLLAAPLETRGTLYFVPPDRLARFTSDPAFSALIIDGAGLRFADAEGGEALDLSASPVARAFVENFIVLFNGDRERLERTYETRFTASDARWELSLTPRGPPLDRLIEGIAMRGDGRGLQEMVVRDRDGDRTTTVFTRVEVDRSFDPSELERLFSLGSPLPEPTGAP